jgi:hypothetical protein
VLVIDESSEVVERGWYAAEDECESGGDGMMMKGSEELLWVCRT